VFWVKCSELVFNLRPRTNFKKFQFLQEMGNISGDQFCDVLCTGVVCAHAGGGLGVQWWSWGLLWSCQSAAVEPKISPAPFVYF
jgi:hypothetical protein